ncbi:hypothetical protein [Dyadobacter sandarakinus]|uniref:Uncharacterized protein n=1 Tax=Dyadobacter sandarakinus TaxID=2747268 RepID=A0ABX7I6X5_9BACT|nr:hypothetical protein [Dyadobacter sandarakinus]QRR01854.1 hypothetical protein HWI92_13510 [Dyadobacter sandarakinus]
MNPEQESLHTLSEIRELMERSSKFLSLSGLSGVFAGIFALIGALVAYVRFKTDWFHSMLQPYGVYNNDGGRHVIWFLIADGLCVLALSLTVCIILTVRKGRQRGLTVWNGTSRRLVISMMIPLAAGGIFCLAMLYYGIIWLVFPATLIFYGIALVNASRFTYKEVFYMGISEILIGCIALFLTGYSLLFWAVGFGLLHIVYGLTMYNRYDRKLPGGALAKGLVVLLMLSGSQAWAQVVNDSSANKVRQWYDQETIYLRGANSFVKNNRIYTGQKALKNEFVLSEGGMQLYLQSRRTRNVALVISLAGSAGSIYSLVSGNRDRLRTFFWVSLGTGIVSSALTMKANNLRDQAVWLRNRDATLFLELNK